ncbi:uncharacterized protein KNAG_0E03580 [Huiozyma naganishii CBS 8797]|uniref:Uncharacterized protein n=1 Tax=Huiozyma naganishii (strain ATCC MYA-139 / BCRC 22969 / CBS 8797 / KCTC 17520 / NBRC 10181 / NCYC 3082 / Yp74L-3) TaxID=1071383 RepID=J7R6Y1_HUIN7|nr:hypothetical protein KNAG_0E03580 [Kazachstania naganishii CBS 8797]CCK70615.1 hypothetical protein KNAG_0E03580 [Kazachstania naganishii CBS 8797]
MTSDGVDGKNVETRNFAEALKMIQEGEKTATSVEHKLDAVEGVINGMLSQVKDLTSGKLGSAKGDEPRRRDDLPDF